MKKLLVTGASGFLGWHICRMAKSEWTVLGTFLSHPLRIPDITLFRVDLTRFQALKDIFKHIKPDAVIHTAANTDINYCQLNRSESRQINTDSAINIAGLCADIEIPCVFTSTDLVFDGLNSPYTEDDEPYPVCVYGEQKVLAEHGMKKRYPSTTICRMALMFGDSGPVAESFLQPMIRTMRAAEAIDLFVDEYRTPLSGKNAAEGLMIALKSLPGTLHLGGFERISRYEFGQLMINVFDIQHPVVNLCKQKNHKMAAPRPPDVSLDCTKAKALGFRADSLKDELRRIR